MERIFRFSFQFFTIWTRLRFWTLRMWRQARWTSTLSAPRRGTITYPLPWPSPKRRVIADSPSMPPREVSLTLIYISDFQMVFTRVHYRGSHSQPMSPCLDIPANFHCYLQVSLIRKYMRKEQYERTNSGWTRFPEERHYWIAKMLWIFIHTAYGVMSPAKMPPSPGNVSWRECLPSWKPLTYMDVSRIFS